MPTMCLPSFVTTETVAVQEHTVYKMMPYALSCNIFRMDWSRVPRTKVGRKKKQRTVYQLCQPSRRHGFLLMVYILIFFCSFSYPHQDLDRNCRPLIELETADISAHGHAANLANIILAIWAHPAGQCTRCIAIDFLVIRWSFLFLYVFYNCYLHIVSIGCGFGTIVALPLELKDAWDERPNVSHILVVTGSTQHSSFSSAARIFVISIPDRLFQTAKNVRSEWQLPRPPVCG
jgi:hypothetical protein